MTAVQAVGDVFGRTDTTHPMKTLDTLSVNEAFNLYTEKHRALEKKNAQRLLEIRTECPDLFDPEKDRMVGELILITKALQESDWYKERLRLDAHKSCAEF